MTRRAPIDDVTAGSSDTSAGANDLAVVAPSATPKGRWERWPLLGTRLGLLLVGTVVGVWSPFWPATGPGVPWWRGALSATVVVCALVAVVLQIMEFRARDSREANDAKAKAEYERQRTALDEQHAQEINRLRARYTTEMASLFGSLSHTLQSQEQSAVFELFLGECAQRFLALVGNEGGCLRSAIYRLEGREDFETPADDVWLQRVTPVGQGRADVPRPRFRYEDDVGRKLIDNLRTKDLLRDDDVVSDRLYKAYLTVPVRSPSGQLLGMMTCDSTDRSVLQERHEQSLRMMAHLVGIGITLMKRRPIRLVMEGPGEDDGHRP